MKKGLIIVHTGNGKGKTTAAFGMVLRAVGHNMKSEIIQFIKQEPSGEITALNNLAPDLVRIRQFGNGFTWNSTDRNKDKQCAEEGWQTAKELIISSNCPLIILDEIFYPINYGFIDIRDVISTLQLKPEFTHVVLTGRDAPIEIQTIADCVSSISAQKHHFHQNITVQKGIEF